MTLISKLERYARDNWDSLLHKYIFEALDEGPEKVLSRVQARLRILCSDLESLEKAWLELVRESTKGEADEADKNRAGI